jgi:cystathionine beta-synthase
MDYSVVDEFYQVNDKESFLMARRLVREEGLFCGGSSGSNVHIAVELAKKLGPGKTIVTVLCDSATRYTTKFLNDQWMKDYGFLGSDRDLGYVEEVLAFRGNRPVITAKESDTLGTIVDSLKRHGVSQVPIVDDAGRVRSLVHEVDILRALQTGSATIASAIKSIAQPVGGLIYPKARIEELYRIFETNQVALVIDNDKIVGVVSQIDVIEYLTNKGR